MIKQMIYDSVVNIQKMELANINVQYLTHRLKCHLTDYKYDATILFCNLVVTLELKTPQFDCSFMVIVSVEILDWVSQSECRIDIPSFTILAIYRSYPGIVNMSSNRELSTKPIIYFQPYVFQLHIVDSLILVVGQLGHYHKTYACVGYCF